MSRQISSAILRLKPSVFATLGERMKNLPAGTLMLHLGDTYHLPPVQARTENLALESHPEFYRYSHPFGQPPLLQALVEKLERHNGLLTVPEALQITCGATQALHCAISTLFDAGQRIALIAPYWPLFGGMVRAAGMEVQELPLTAALARGEIADLEEWLRSHLEPDCRALYFCNPNNPDGYVYRREELQALATVACERDLWVISDEVYEHYIYDGHRHFSIAALPGMKERTLTAFSFSKSYAMAGHRLGYLVGDPVVMRVARRAANHTVYNVSPTLQFAAWQALLHGDAFLASVTPGYARARDTLHRALPATTLRPHGGAYLFFPTQSEEAAWSLVLRGLDKGLAMAPGAAFGESFAHEVRICFTAAPFDGIEQAAQILSGLLA